ncbi:MAG: SDR family oxidoreductase [Bacteroidota bacterium]
MNVIVTGASKGIGKAITAQFAAAGHQLFLCSRGEKSLYDTINELQTRFPNAVIVGRPTNMTNKNEVTAFANWCLQKGTPDILVNNAGQFISGSVHNEPDGSLEEMLQSNLFSAYHLTRQLLPSMITAKRGHVFNICSVASLHAYANGGSYSISKYAMAGFSRNLREEMKSYGIKVTAVYPGAALTASWDGFDIDPKRIMEADDVAKMVYAASQLSPMAVTEDIVLRPQLGDL